MLFIVLSFLLFLSTPSARRATYLAPPGCPVCVISIHALRKEGDVIFVVRDVRDAGFLSTPSARRATDLPGGLVQKLHISIHALRKEGDR